MKIDSTRSPHFLALDGWRGISACMVALHHFRANSHVDDLSVVRNSYLFVDFFFVLSGFVIFSNYYERLRLGFSLKRFMFLRFGRLYPLHFVLVVALIIGDVFQFVFPFLNRGAQFPPFQGPGEGWQYIVSNVFLAHSLGIHDRLTLNGPSWSISCEFYVYFVFAIIISTFCRAKLLVAIISIAAMISIVIWSPKYMDTTYDLGFIRCLYGFGFGGLAWLLFTEFNNSFDYVGPGSATVVEFLVLILVGVFLAEANNGVLSVAAPWIFSLTVFVYAFEAGVISNVLKAPMITFLGALSYSLYMMSEIVHGKVFNGFGHLAESVFGVRIFGDFRGTERLGSSVWWGDLLTAGFFVVLISVSFVTYRVIELPCRDLFRKLAK